MIRSLLARILSVRIKDSEVKTKIKGPDGEMELIILRYGKGPGILWIHGGGYVLGMASMVYYSMGRMLARIFGGVVVSPEYRLAKQAPYPAALEDCYTALKYMYDHADELGIDRNRIIVGGESAGGGLAAAVCMYARDKGEVPVSFQIPLYPMLDCEDTGSSRDNHAYVWDTNKETDIASYQLPNSTTTVIATQSHLEQAELEFNLDISKHIDHMDIIGEVKNISENKYLLKKDSVLLLHLTKDLTKQK
jgi:acetyl esterase/lipase